MSSSYIYTCFYVCINCLLCFFLEKTNKMYAEYIMEDEDDQKLPGLQGALNELCNNETKYMER